MLYQYDQLLNTAAMIFVQSIMITALFGVAEVAPEEPLSRRCFRRRGGAHTNKDESAAVAGLCVNHKPLILRQIAGARPLLKGLRV